MFIEVSLIKSALTNYNILRNYAASEIPLLDSYSV